MRRLYNNSKRIHKDSTQNVKKSGRWERRQEGRKDATFPLCPRLVVIQTLKSEHNVKSFNVGGHFELNGGILSPIISVFGKLRRDAMPAEKLNKAFPSFCRSYPIVGTDQIR